MFFRNAELRCYEGCGGSFVTLILFYFIFRLGSEESCGMRWRDNEGTKGEDAGLQHWDQLMR